MKKLSKEYKLMQRLKRRLNQALFDYKLIEEGDHVLIGVSGGKDSLALLELLAQRAQITKPKFRVSAAHVVMSNIPYQSDSDYLAQFAQELGVPYHLKISSFDPSTDKRKTPCFLCSWNRRKVLFDLSKELGCNKIAFGHHMDDILTTLLMNMTFQGSFSTMPPKLQMNKFEMQIIRPLCLIEERDLVELAEWRGYKKQLKNCPYETKSNRNVMEEVLAYLSGLSPDAKYSLWSSMTNINPELLPPKLK